MNRFVTEKEAVERRGKEAPNNGDTRPLFEQLAENRAKKEAEKAALLSLQNSISTYMDDEDEEWISELTERTRQDEATKRAAERAELSAFREAAKEVDVPPPTSAEHAPEQESAEPPKSTKRKTATLTGVIAKKAKAAAPVKKVDRTGPVKLSVTETKSAAKPAAQTNALGALDAYGSDSD